MKLFLSIAAILLFGCMTGNEREAFQHDGQYQDQANSALLTVAHPEWTVKFYTQTPNLIVSGKMESFSLDTMVSQDGDNTAKMFFTNASCIVKEFYQVASDGTKIKADSSILPLNKFHLNTGSFSASIRFNDKTALNDSLRPIQPIWFISKSFTRQ